MNKSGINGTRILIVPFGMVTIANGTICSNGNCNSKDF